MLARIHECVNCRKGTRSAERRDDLYLARRERRPWNSGLTTLPGECAEQNSETPQKNTKKHKIVTLVQLKKNNSIRPPHTHTHIHPHTQRHTHTNCHNPTQKPKQKGQNHATATLYT